MCWDEHFWVNSFTKNLVIRRTTSWPQFLVVLTYFVLSQMTRGSLNFATLRLKS